MPTYDYMCCFCGVEFEAFHSMSMEPLISCPDCGQSTLIKLIGPGLTPIIKGTKTPCTGRPKPKVRDRLGEGKNKGEKPFWRDGKIDKRVLKNPEKYIRTGEIG